MTYELYNKVKDEIPTHIGVLAKGCFGSLESIKQAKRQEIEVDSKTLFQSMIRSMQRDNSRYYKIVNIIKE